MSKTDLEKKLNALIKANQEQMRVISELTERFKEQKEDDNKPFNLPAIRHKHTNHTGGNVRRIFEYIRDNPKADYESILNQADTRQKGQTAISYIRVKMRNNPKWTPQKYA